MKHTNFLRIVGISFFSLLMLLSAIPSFGAQYPTKPVTIIMTWPAGGGTDISFRPLVAAASKILGQPLPIEYHPGGATSVGLGVLKIKKADGNWMGMTSASAIASQHMRKVHYNLLKDFTIIMQYADHYGGIVVQSSSPWKTLPELINHVTANPGKIRYCTTGPGGAQHLAMASLGQQLGLQWIHIPFEGGPPAVSAILGGHVEAYSTTMQAKPHILDGRLRLLATYGDKRNPSFPNVPTLQELGYQDRFANSMILLAPKGLAPDHLETLHQGFKKAMADPDFIKACGMVDHAIIYRNPSDTVQYLQKIDQTFGKLIRDLNLREGK
jgi:tripartite-type tricarboxylate transporter receptor subunit TctC